MSHSSNQLYGYDSNFSKRFDFTLCSKCNSQLTRDQKSYYKNNTPNSDSSFRFKLVIKTPDLTKPAKAITLEKKPVDYYEFEELILQRVCEAVEAVGLLVRNDYELPYKSEKGIGAGTILEEEEDFEEFIKEYYRKMKYLILDDGEESICEENEITPPSKQ
ncbi:unnamed protein product [Rhizophagus irregularis]|nr:unnamed protein product [Rhizophagus irregularis]